MLRASQISLVINVYHVIEINISILNGRFAKNVSLTNFHRLDQSAIPPAKHAHLARNKTWNSK